MVVAVSGDWRGPLFERRGIGVGDEAVRVGGEAVRVGNEAVQVRDGSIGY